MSRRDRLFLDANILFSAAWREDSGLRRMWKIPGLLLVSSAYAVEEARRNLSEEARHDALERLLEKVEIAGSGVAALEDEEIEKQIASSGLPEKYVSILRAAVESGATHLVTGDRRHFGHLYGKSVAGVIVTDARAYLGG